MSEVLLVDEIACENGDGFIAKVTINRPDKLNSLNANVMTKMKEMATWVNSNDDVRCVIITGAKPNPPTEGKRMKPNAFVAGADITEFVGASSEDIRSDFEDNGCESIWNITKPTIAMIDGFALGGGCEIACVCDIRIASKRSMFGTPEIKLGLIPGFGGTQRLVKIVGLGKTMEMVMSGEPISADEALAIGLANHIVEHDKLEEKTMLIAQTIASKSMHTLNVAKKTIRAALDNGITEGVKIEANEFANLFDTEDKEIGVQAFLSRETPNWKHR
ncbi:MAG: enoyl-CoA hydratase/isomerase family protein [Candidatus Poseidoniaceae archaeon]|jgi:enoyl-CoA hydratase/carnithine racemase|nr:enoyl-CoA hydratase/isomerase family protein [Candidatus Poseidoniaceae archaeon]